MEDMTEKESKIQSLGSDIVQGFTLNEDRTKLLVAWICNTQLTLPASKNLECCRS